MAATATRLRKPKAEKPPIQSVVTSRPFMVQGEVMKEVRRLLGVEQTVLASRFGVDVGTLSRWERGSTKVMPQITLMVEAVASRAMKEKEITPVTMHTLFDLAARLK